jgi:addiction module HigA family antidote
MTNYIPTPTIGEILKEEFMEPLNISAYKLAQSIHVPTSRIQDILHDRRKITADTSLRLKRKQRRSNKNKRKPLRGRKFPERFSSRQKKRLTSQ